MWSGLQAITDFKKENNRATQPALSLPGELNTLYARFEVNSNNTPTVRPAEDQDDCTPVLMVDEVRRTFKKVNPRRSPGPDGILGRVLRGCADQLAEVFTYIFNLSLEEAIVPICFKQATIIPVPKKNTVTCLNDYRPVALTSIIMKSFERLVKTHICSILPGTIDPLQFAYHPNRSTTMQ